MCLLIVKPADVAIDSIPQLCAKANRAHDDGFGVAYVRDGDIIVHKGLLSVKDQCDAIDDIGMAPALIHWRAATSGEVDAVRCHPFVLADGSAIAHNGILNDIVIPKGMSDTERLAELAGDCDTFIRVARTLAGPCNKFAALSADGGLAIAGEEHGVWRDGVWLSNTVHESLTQFSSALWRPMVDSRKSEPELVREYMRPYGYWDDLRDDVLWLLREYSADDIIDMLARCSRADDCDDSLVWELS